VSYFFVFKLSRNRLDKKGFSYKIRPDMKRDRFRVETSDPTDKERGYLESGLIEIREIIAKKFGSRSLAECVAVNMKDVARDLSDDPPTYNIQYIQPREKVKRNWHKYEENIQGPLGEIPVSRAAVFYDDGHWDIEIPNPPTNKTCEKIKAYTRDEKVIIYGILSATKLLQIVSERQLSNPELDNYQLIDSLKSLPGNPNLHFIFTDSPNGIYINLPTLVR
jgi:hypothetical protein